MARITLTDLRTCKDNGQKIAMLTAYNYPIARIIDATGVHIVLVGDSLGTTALGYDSTLPVTMEDMVSAVAAVARGVQEKFIVADMPFLSYHTSVADAVRNAGSLVRAGAHAVKIEGADHLEAVSAILKAGVPVMGHIGFTPQSVNRLGGYRVQGRSEEQAQVLLREAEQLAETGVFAVVLEMVPAEVAASVASAVSCITIGIGAGPHVDGQVLVTDDILGLCDRFNPRFVRQYASLEAEIRRAMNAFCSDVQEGAFPAAEHCF